MSVIEEQNGHLPIMYHGWLIDEEIEKVFEQSNIGIIYNPVTPYYTNNISTKLFEYIFSGMPVISVNNKSAEKVIDKTNGTLIEDNSAGFYNGLVQFYQNQGKYKSDEIAKTCEEYSVEYNIKNKIVPAFNSIINEK